mmetsp:Transcript_3314/g.3483  ORF Transcript_3314/g.3483 Transcript_3314/m.3483 type:complete len:124 (+) Transcript_3314:750-1121(+)
MMEIIRHGMSKCREPLTPLNFKKHPILQDMSDLWSQMCTGHCCTEVCIYTPRMRKKGTGKLRILYEGFPMAMIMESAGGAASTGPFRGAIRNILDIVPLDIHDKCPVIIGCNRDVDMVLAYYK